MAGDNHGGGNRVLSPKIYWWASLVLLVLLTAISFSPALSGTFIWDDHVLIEHNPHVRSFAQLREGYWTSFWQASQAEEGSYVYAYYRPLVTLSYMLDYQLFGMNPHGFHLTNVILHLLVVLLALWVAGDVLGRRSLPAFVAVLLFAVHPTKAESVSWISGRTDILMTLFILLAVGLLWRAMQAEQRRRRVLWAVAGWTALLGALLSKETAVACLLVLPVLDWLLVSRRDRRQFLKNTYWLHGPLVALMLTYLGLRLWLQLGRQSRVFAHSSADWLATVLQSLGHYAALVVNPYEPSGQISTLFHPGSLDGSMVLLGSVVLVAGLAGLVWAWRAQPRAAVSLVIAGAFIVPVSNLIPMKTGSLVYERFLYLPLFGVCLLAALGIAALVKRRAMVGMWLAIIGVVVCTWSITAYLRSKDYQDPVRFWRAEVASAPQSALALVTLAKQLVERRQLAEAESLLIRAVQAWNQSRRHPFQGLQASLLVIDLKLVRAPELATAFLPRAASFLESLLDYLNQPVSADNRAALSLGDKLTLVLEVSSPSMQQALERHEAQLWYMLGSIRSRLGQDAAAIEALERAKKLVPRQPSTSLNLVLAQARALDLAAAQRTLAQALELAPAAPELERLGQALALAQERLQALHALGLRGSQLEEPLASDARAHRLLAEIYIVTRASGRAIAHLRQVVQLAPEDRQGWSMLALELAAGGDVPAAQQVIAQARERFGDEHGLDELQQRVLQVAPRERSLSDPLAGGF